MCLFQGVSLESHIFILRIFLPVRRYTNTGICYGNSVCLSVCLIACLKVKPDEKLLKGFRLTLPVVVVRYSSDDNVMRYVLPVLWMTSRFHMMARHR